MTPQIYEELVQSLRRGELPLARLHALAVDAGSTWSVEQLHLMLACMDGIEMRLADNGEMVVSLGQRSQQEELVEAVIEVVRTQGRPVPAAQVMSLLPSKFTTSVEQVKKLARESRGLKVIGPGLIDLDIT
jgi:hypothetical protein